MLLQPSTRLVLLAGSLAALALTGGCGGDDPVSYSAPVGINLKAKSGDVSQTVISEEKAITTESSNPYGKFITDAQTQLGGNDPSRVEIERLTLLLGADSTNVLGLDEVYAGDVDVAIVMSDSDNTYDVGHVSDPTGTEAEVSVVFDSAAVAAQDWDRFLAGSFKVVIRGPAADSFSSKGAEADLQLTFTFGAYE
jgi:hypothetical protein